jgi:Overcoming lysogenization defect protein-like, TOPRIM domain
LHLPQWTAPTSWTCRRLSSSARAAILVEGTSDLVAIEALADHRGVDLDAAGIMLVPMGGAQAIGHFLGVFVPQGLRLGGLCDAAEESEFVRGLERARLGSNLTRDGMEEIGFFVCVEDLEDELVRAHGAAAVEQVIEAEGDLGSFRTLQRQPAWQGRPVEEQLRRFMGSGGSRKIRYARRLVDALDPARIPRPLDEVLAHVS